MAIADAKTRAKTVGQKVTIQLPTKEQKKGPEGPEISATPCEIWQETGPSTQRPQPG